MAENELSHYGVKGMRWGHRKKLPESTIAANVRKTKEAYKTANKAYSKAFDKAYNRNIGSFSPIKKHREASNARWEDALTKAETANKAHDAYKAAKKERRSAIKETRRDLNKKASLGEKLVYSDATRKRAAKFIVDNNMSVAEATKKAKGEAWKNTAAVLAVCGAVTMAELYTRGR